MDYDDTRPTFNDVADFVREWARISAKKQITPDTQFERDLGITGDDGYDLLVAAQNRFKVKLAAGESGYRTDSSLVRMSIYSTLKAFRSEATRSIFSPNRFSALLYFCS